MRANQPTGHIRRSHIVYGKATPITSSRSPIDCAGHADMLIWGISFASLGVVWIRVLARLRPSLRVSAEASLVCYGINSGIASSYQDIGHRRLHSRHSRWFGISRFRIRSWGRF